MNNIILLAGEAIDNVTNSLKFTVFNKNQIVILLKKLSNKKKNFPKKYNQGKIKCAICSKTIGPKSKQNLILGAVIIEGNKIKFICNQIDCYEKGLRKK